MIEQATVATRTAPGFWRRWGTLVVMAVCSFMITLDFFIVNVAIPSLQRGLAANAAAIQLVIAGYGLAYACGLITWGRLGDMYGRRRIFGLGIGLFTVASAACALAPTAGGLVVARVVQGLAAALMAPQVLAILGIVYTGVDRARAFNIDGLAMGLAAVLGQLIGGVLIHADVYGLGWRLCFLINVPVGVAALMLTPRVVPETRGAGRAGLDLAGAALIAGGLLAAVVPLIEGRQHGWPLWSWLCLAVAAPLIVAFAVRQRRLTARGGSPLIDVSLFRRGGFAVGLAMTLLYYAGMGAFFLVVALYLQNGVGLSALSSGLVTTAGGVGFLAASVVCPRLTRSLGRGVLALGALALAVGWVALGAVVARIGVSGHVALLVPALATCGVGMGLIMAPLASTTLAGIPAHDAGAASGLLSTALQVGSAVGVALIGIVFYGSLGKTGGYPHALNLCLIDLVGLSLAVATLARFLPKSTP